MIARAGSLAVGVLLGISACRAVPLLPVHTEEKPAEEQTHAGVSVTGCAGQTVESANQVAQLLSRARSAERKRDWKAARDSYDQALSVAPDCVTAAVGLGRCDVRIDNFRSALVSSQRAVALSSGYGPALVVRGEALLRSGEPERAMEVLAKGLEYGRTVGEAAWAADAARGHLALGRLLIASGEEKKGIEELEAAYGLAPNDPDVLLRIAGAAATRKDAVGFLQRYLDLSEGEDPEKRESVRGTLLFYNALGETPVWVLDGRRPRTVLPLWPISRSPGSLEGFVLELRAVGKEEEKERKIRCLLDTGASGLFLSSRAARKLRLKELSAATIFGGGGAGRHETFRGIVPKLSAGELEFRNATVTVSGEEVDPLGRYEGILGPDVFESFRVLIDPPGRRMILEDVTAEADSTSDTDGSSGARADAELIVWKMEGQLLLRVGMNGGASGLMMIDTGASRSVLSLTAAESLEGIVRRRRSGATYGFAGKVERAEDITGLDLSLAGIAARNMAVVGIDLSRRSRFAGTEVAGYIGLDVLRDHVLDFSRGMNRLRIGRPDRRAGVGKDDGPTRCRAVRMSPSSTYQPTSTPTRGALTET